MRYIFKFPDIGEGLEEGKIIEWLVKKGQTVEVGDSLVTVETDKVVADIPSPKDGVLVELFGEVDEVIHVGDALVEIELEGTAVATKEESSNSKPKQEMVKEDGDGVVGTLEIAKEGAVLASSNEGVGTKIKQTNKLAKKILATPVARLMAKDLGVDINMIEGTGPAGRVMKADIQKHAKSSTSPKSKSNLAQSTSVSIEPLSQIRKTISKNMTRSKQNAVHMTVFDEVEISELARVRDKFKSEYFSKGVKLTYLSFIVKSVALALKKNRVLNSELDLSNGNIIYKQYYNIGIAVDTEKGLVVPVIKNVDNLSIIEIAEEIKIISDKAKSGKLTIEDFKDGTFTITNYGSIGGQFGVPVINFPEVGILGVGRINKQPIVKDNKVEVGLIIPLSLCVDHRVVDGGEASRFLNMVMAYLAEPVTLTF